MNKQSSRTLKKSSVSNTQTMRSQNITTQNQNQDTDINNAQPSFNPQQSQFKSKYSSMSGGVSQISKYYGSQIAHLQERGNMTANRIEKECKKLQEIEKEIEKAQGLLEQRRKEIMEKKRADGNDNDPRALENKVKSMYHRLELLEKKSNESNAQNETLKEQINQLRREKNIFDQIYDEQQIDLQDKKDKLKKVLHQSKVCKQEIENGEKKLDTFKEDAQVDKEQIETQIQSIIRIFDHQGQESALQRRFNSTQEQRDAEKQSIYTNNFITQPEKTDLPPMSQEQKKQYHKEQQQRHQDNEQHQLLELKKEVRLYEDTFKRLKQETGKENISEIAATLVEYEEKNYGLFRDINAIREDLDELEKQRVSQNKEINQQRKIPKQVRNNKQMLKFEKLKKDIEVAEKKKQQHIDNHSKLKELIEELKVNLPIAFDKIKCNSQAYEKEFQEEFDLNNIDESNMLQYLAVIERRTFDLLQLYQEVNKNRKDDEVNQKKNTNNYRKTEDLETALVQRDEEIEELNYKLKDYYMYSDIPIKERNIQNKNQLSTGAKEEIAKIVYQQEQKNLKGKKQKRP